MAAHTWFVVSSYAGALQFAWVRGAHSDYAFALREREHLETVLGIHAVVRVFRHDQIPPDLTVYA